MSIMKKQSTVVVLRLTSFVNGYAEIKNSNYRKPELDYP